MKSRLAPLIGDVIAVLVFATIGRRSHAEGLTLGGVWHTAWPFLVGLAVGWVVLLATKFASDRVWPAGVTIWGSTVVLGLIVRGAIGDGLRMPFPIVAGVSLAVVLLIPRVIAARVRAKQSVAP